MKYAVFAALVPGALIIAAAKAPPQPVLTHTGPWDVHVSENACLLGRKFGDGDRETFVAFQPLFNAETGELFVMTNDRRGGQRTGTATVTEQPSGLTIKVRYFSNHLPKEDQRVTRMTIPLSIWRGLANTDVLTITAAPVDVGLKLVRYAAAAPVFEKCERDMLKTWGVDPIALDPAFAPKPLHSPVSFFSSEDYPKEAIAAGHVGRVVAILDVDAQGLSTNCRIGSSSWPDLNEKTCKQARRVRFSPAHDSAGRAIRSVYMLPVRWMMPGASF